MVDEPGAAQPEADGGAHVVPGARGHGGRGGQPEVIGRPGGQRTDVGRAGRGHRGERRGVQAEELEDSGIVGTCRDGVPAGARGVAGVGDGGAREPFGQEVVGQAYGRGRGGDVRLVLLEPPPLRRGDGGHRYRPGPRGPGVRAAERLGECGGLRGGAGVVPQHRVAQRTARTVEDDQSVLLSGDRDAGHRRRGDPGFLQPGGDGVAQCPPPRLRVALPGPQLTADDVRRAADGEQPAAPGVDEGRLGGLGGTVHADDDGTRRHGALIPVQRAGAAGAARVLVVCKTKYATESPTGSGSARGYASEEAHASLVMTVNK